MAPEDQQHALLILAIRSGNRTQQLTQERWNVEHSLYLYRVVGMIRKHAYTTVTTYQRYPRSYALGILGCNLVRKWIAHLPV